jgi:uracil DNA glycosylase
MKISQSMCGLLQMIAEHRSGDSDYRGKGGLRRAFRAEDVNIEPPCKLFDRWRDQGVLCLNTSLTLTRYVRGGAKEQLQGHIPFWRPVVAGVMRVLAQRAEGQVVFLLLGKPAWKIADLIGIQAEAKAAGSWDRSVGQARPYHPSYRGSKRNGLIEANDRFAVMGVNGIDW